MSLWLECQGDVLEDDAEVMFAWVFEHGVEVDEPQTWVVRELAEHLDDDERWSKRLSPKWTPCISTNDGENWDELTLGKGELP